MAQRKVWIVEKARSVSRSRSAKIGDKLKHDDTVKYPREVEEKLTNIMDKIVETHRRIHNAKVSCTTKKENCVQLKELEDNIRKLQKEYGQVSAPYLKADEDNKAVPFVYPIGPLEKKEN